MLSINHLSRFTIRHFSASMFVLVFVAVAGISNHAHAMLIADLRPDYDTPTTPHTDGQTSLGKIPDTLGSGTWNFYSSATAAAGASPTLMTYTTSAGTARNPFVYATPGNPPTYDFPAVSNVQVATGDSSAPGATQLSVHSGNEASLRPYLVLRWTSGVTTTANIAGAINDAGLTADGIAFQIFLNGATSIFGPNTSSGNTAIPFNINQAVAPGNFIDFVIGPNVNFNADGSVINVQINGDVLAEAVPEPSTLVLAALGLAGLGLVAWRRRK